MSSSSIHLIPFATIVNLAISACGAPAHPAAGNVYVLTSVDGRPLPARDSMSMYDGTWRPLVELQTATLTFEDDAKAFLSSTQRDLVAARMPCEALRESARLDSLDRIAPGHTPGGSLTAIADTTTTGCDELSMATRIVRGSIHFAGDTLNLIMPDSVTSGTVEATTMVGFFYPESVVITSMRTADTSVHVPFGGARLVFVRKAKQP